VTWTAQRSVNTPLRGDVTGIPRLLGSNKQLSTALLATPVNMTQYLCNCKMYKCTSGCAINSLYVIWREVYLSRYTPNTWQLLFSKWDRTYTRDNINARNMIRVHIYIYILWRICAMQAAPHLHRKWQRFPLWRNRPVNTPPPLSTRWRGSDSHCDVTVYIYIQCSKLL
jgi:hypothetical protein